MVETPPTAANMRLDGGHPALDLVNTIYGQVGQPPEHDVLQTPEDLRTFAARVGVGHEADAAAVKAARDLRAACEAAFRDADADALAVHARAAYAAGRLEPGGWTWPDEDPLSIVHRLAHAATQLISSEDLDRLRGCNDCCWLYLDRSKNRSRKWCSMADCGTNAKKRRYVEKRRLSRP
ncbi:ABATE domain-containing protein [Solirubrobacter sp. CPCC 204708]|uniref:ABATE domain-containing protein n=1 Tax=Solirubrobacter deserti TaxID=2282478 RepID=A0ABT4RQ19_9ACTN|nr:ABATE domain-containing protein [Solirubrobacter deserti]MBE2320608.1 ABATE domain-containing protein [Solirubrobacter deserti]MDA0140663.1 ABATE domain-containing protein [Solirubrobacter deserti]